VRRTWPQQRRHRILTQALARRRAVRAELERDARFLRPGLWSLESQKMARHVRTGQLPATFDPAEAGSVTRGSGPVGTARWLLRQPFKLTWVRRSKVTEPAERPHAGRYAVWLARRYTPENVLFDVERRRVLRIREEGDQTRSDVPRRLSRHLDVAPFTALPGQRLFVEEFLRGELFAAAPSARRFAAFRRLLEGYTSLVLADRAGSAEPLVATAMQRAGSATLPPVLAAWLDGNVATLLTGAHRWPLVPSHSDLTGDNVVLRAGHPVLIDFEWASYYPFFYDPLSLVIREASTGRTDLLDACCSGRFDAEIRALCGAARYEDADLCMLLVATLLIRCDRSTRRGEQVDRARYERHLARLWRPLDGVLA
jgi:hypothetical protein